MTEKELNDIESRNEKAAAYEVAPGVQLVIDQDGRRAVSAERSVRIEIHDVPVLLPATGVDADGLPCSTAEDLQWYLETTKEGTDIPVHKFCRVVYWEYGRPVLSTAFKTWIREPEGERLETFQKWLAGAMQAIAPYLLGETKYVAGDEKKGSDE